MAKLALVPLLFVVACIFAGTYGALHNQISYTVAPEYFTKFKFYQFRIDDTVPERVGAAIVGWKAAWWMGMVIGLGLIPWGLQISGSKNYFWGMVRVFGVVAITTLVVGFSALIGAFILIDPDTLGGYTRYGNPIVDNVAFARAGAMHNFSYLGGIIGILTGGMVVLRYRKRPTMD